MRATADNQPQRFTHSSNVRSNIDRIGHYQHGHDGVENRAREMATDVVGKPMACDAPHPGANQLNADHQGIGQHHGPAELIAELRARLRVRRNTAGIVVRGSGNQAGSQLPQPAARSFNHGSSFRQAICTERRVKRWASK